MYIVVYTCTCIYVHMYVFKLWLEGNQFLPGPFKARLLRAKEAAFWISTSSDRRRWIIGSKKCISTGSCPIMI